MPTAGKPRRKSHGSELTSKIFRCLFFCLLLAGCAAGWGATPIGKIHAAPREYDGRNVTVSGTAASGMNLILVKYFVLKDETGEIPVITGGVIPAPGEKVTVTGEVKEAFALGEQRLIVIIESGQ